MMAGICAIPVELSCQASQSLSATAQVAQSVPEHSMSAGKNHVVTIVCRMKILGSQVNLGAPKILFEII